MYCSNCGTECSNQAQYCMNCGQKLVDTGEQKYKEGNPPFQESAFLKPRLPVAGIFLILHGLIFLNNAMFEKEWHYGRGWRTIFVGPGGSFSGWHFCNFLSLLLQLFFYSGRKRIKRLLVS